MVVYAILVSWKHGNQKTGTNICCNTKGFSRDIFACDTMEKILSIMHWKNIRIAAAVRDRR